MTAGSGASEPTIALYVSGHGFGHAVRATEVARALLARGARVLLRTDAPAWLFPPGVQWLDSPGWPVDIGIVQRDGLTMDLPATITAWDYFGPRMDERAATEAEVLRRNLAQVVLGDMPPLAFLAARHAGLPSAAVTNFAWDWIYAVLPGFERATGWVQQGFRAANILFRLPLHAREADAFPSFTHIEDVPLIARTRAVPRAETRADLGLPADATVVLLSFGGFDATALNLRALWRVPHVTFVLTSPLSAEGPLPPNVVVLEREHRDYFSLIAACDAVVTKPGYGIVVDCLVNHVPVLYTDRGPFREYPVLVEALHRLGRARHISAAELVAGEIEQPLRELFADDHPWANLDVTGAEVLAERVIAAAASGTFGRS